MFFGLIQTVTIQSTPRCVLCVQKECRFILKFVQLTYTLRYFPECCLKHAIEHLVLLQVAHCFEIQYSLEQCVAATTKKGCGSENNFKNFKIAISRMPNIFSNQKSFILISLHKCFYLV